MSEKIVLLKSLLQSYCIKMLKSQGDKVIADEPIVELETDKVNVEVPAPTNGVLGTIVVKEGETVNVGSLLGTISNINQTSSDSKEIKNYNPPKKTLPSEPKLFEIKEKIPTPKIKKTKKAEPILKLEEESQEFDEEPLILEETFKEQTKIKKTSPVKKETKISPAARKMATESNININELQGSGKNGVILKEDIMSLMGTKPSPSERIIKYGPEERVRMTRLRLTIAKRLKEAQENAAMLTTFNEVDMSEVINMRNRYKDEFQNNYKVKLGYVFFRKSMCNRPKIAPLLMWKFKMMK